MTYCPHLTECGICLNEFKNGNRAYHWFEDYICETCARPIQRSLSFHIWRDHPDQGAVVRDNDACIRLGLIHGQFFSDYRLKNLHWMLNGREIGFGDLRDEDILVIQSQLEENEVFEGYNEHHMTNWMQCENPLIRIQVLSVQHPDFIPLSAETRKLVRNRH